MHPQSSFNSDKQAKQTWNQVYDANTLSLWSIHPVPYISNRVINFFKERGAEKILDLPCGDGRNTIPLTWNFAEVIAADSSATAIKKAENNLQKLGISNCSFQVTDVFETIWKNGEFDCILCWDLIGHLKEVNLALNELLRILKPGGFLVANVFSLNDSTRTMENMERIGTNEAIYDNRFYFRFYTEPDVIALLEESSISSYAIEIANWVEPPHPGYREYEHSHESYVMIIKKEMTNPE